MRAGIFNYFSFDQGTDPFGSVARRNRAIRQLIHPEGMGDRLQVLIQSKGLSNPQLQIMNDRLEALEKRALSRRVGVCRDLVPGEQAQRSFPSGGADNQTYAM